MLTAAARSSKGDFPLMWEREHRAELLAAAGEPLALIGAILDVPALKEPERVNPLCAAVASHRRKKMEILGIRIPRRNTSPKKGSPFFGENMIQI